MFEQNGAKLTLKRRTLDNYSLKGTRIVKYFLNYKILKI